MPLNEFQLIKRYFAEHDRQRPDVVRGIGDDCALLRVPPATELALSIDTLVEGRHFPVGTDPRAIGHKSLAVGLSDLAAMGASPSWLTLALSLPDVDEDWLDGFAAGLFALADHYDMQLIGGDTVRGPRVISIQVHGLLPADQALRRDGAQPGDLVFVTGTLGDAGHGLELALSDSGNDGDGGYLRGRLDYPSPRVEAGMVLRGVASAAIDVSDGLLADLGHIVTASGVGARIDATALPLSGPLLRCVGERAGRDLALRAGDDYELCFTVAPDRVERLRLLDVPYTQIGEITAESGLEVCGVDPTAGADAGFDHFSGDR